MLGPSQHLTHSDLLAQILTTLKKVEYLQYRPGYLVDLLNRPLLLVFPQGQSQAPTSIISSSAHPSSSGS